MHILTSFSNYSTLSVSQALYWGTFIFKKNWTKKSKLHVDCQFNSYNNHVTFFFCVWLIYRLLGAYGKWGERETGFAQFFLLMVNFLILFIVLTLILLIYFYRMMIVLMHETASHHDSDVNTASVYWHSLILSTFCPQN